MTVASPRVLLISESRITRRVVEMTFADQQVELVTAVTSQEGLAAWDDTPATVVLADLTMDAPPDGIGVARHVHANAHAGGRHVTVLLMAGQHDAVDDAEMAAAGVRGVLRKPLDSLQLIEAVRGAVRASRGQAPWAPPAPPESVAPPAGVVDLPEPAPASADALPEEAPAMTMADPTMPHPLGDEDLERVAARVAAIWSGDEDRERRLASLLADRAEQTAAATAAAAAERVAPAATSEAAERLVRELAPALVAEVARLVVVDVSERLVREEIARMRSSSAGR
jgi:CheY-like chemotaxis protein